MLDQIVGWIVIFLPFGLSVLFIFIPERKENAGAHMKWRIVLVFLGVAFSCITWWQQDRSIKTAANERENAIRKTAKQTAESVTKAINEHYAPIVASFNQQIGSLQQKIIQQGKDVRIIKGSNIVTGKTPVKVEVTNESLLAMKGTEIQPSEIQSPELHVLDISIEKNENEHLRIIQINIQNLGGSGTSAHLTPNLVINGISLPSPSSTIPDRLDFGPHQGFKLSYSLDEKDIDSWLEKSNSFEVKIDIAYSSKDREKLDKRYRHVGRYNPATKSFDIIESGFVIPNQ
jgi:hypothetical protein